MLKKGENCKFIRVGFFLGGFWLEGGVAQWGFYFSIFVRGCCSAGPVLLGGIDDIYVSSRVVVLSGGFKAWFKTTLVFSALGFQFKEEEIWRYLAALISFSGFGRVYTMSGLYLQYCKFNSLNAWGPGREAELRRLITFIIVLEKYNEVVSHGYRVGSSKGVKFIALDYFSGSGGVSTVGLGLLGVPFNGLVVVQADKGVVPESDMFPACRSGVEDRLNSTRVKLNMCVYRYLSASVMVDFASFSAYPTGGLSFEEFSGLKKMMEELYHVSDGGNSSILFKFGVDSCGRPYPLYGRISSEVGFIRVLFEPDSGSSLVSAGSGLGEVESRSLQVVSLLLGRSFGSLSEAHTFVVDKNVSHLFMGSPEKFWFLLFFMLNGYLPPVQLGSYWSELQHYSALMNNLTIGRMSGLVGGGGPFEFLEEVFSVWYGGLSSCEKKNRVQVEAVRGLLSSEGGQGCLNSLILGYFRGFSMDFLLGFLKSLAEKGGIDCGSFKSLSSAIVVVMGVEPSMEQFRCGATVSDGSEICLPDGFKVGVLRQSYEWVKVEVSYGGLRHYFCEPLPVGHVDSAGTRRSFIGKVLVSLSACHDCLVIGGVDVDVSAFFLRGLVLVDISDFSSVSGIPKECFLAMYGGSGVKLLEKFLSGLPPCEGGTERVAHERLVGLKERGEFRVASVQGCFEVKFPWWS